MSHAIRWTIHHLKFTNLDFTTGSPLTIPRGGSFDGLSEGGDLEPVSDENVSNKSGSFDSTAKWFAKVIESNGALSDQKPDKKPVQILRLAIEVNSSYFLHDSSNGEHLKHQSIYLTRQFHISLIKKGFYRQSLLSGTISSLYHVEV